LWGGGGGGGKQALFHKHTYILHPWGTTS
jgi:hypothetical protein